MRGADGQEVGPNNAVLECQSWRRLGREFGQSPSACKVAARKLNVGIPRAGPFQSGCGIQCFATQLLGRSRAASLVPAQVWQFQAFYLALPPLELHAVPGLPSTQHHAPSQWKISCICLSAATASIRAKQPIAWSSWPLVVVLTKKQQGNNCVRASLGQHLIPDDWTRLGLYLFSGTPAARRVLGLRWPEVLWLRMHSRAPSPSTQIGGDGV